MAELRWVMLVNDVDGEHVIATAASYEAIKKRAVNWLGDNAVWDSPYWAVSAYGGVVRLVEGGKVGKCACCHTKTVIKTYSDSRYNGFCDNCYHCIDKLVCKYCPRERNCKRSFLKEVEN